MFCFLNIACYITMGKKKRITSLSFCFITGFKSEFLTTNDVIDSFNSTAHHGKESNIHKLSN
jgi:hypothetical protein